MISDKKIHPFTIEFSIMIRCLSLFQRTFTTIVNYSNLGDKCGILLGGWLIDTIHNAPYALLGCNDQRYQYTTIESVEQDIVHLPQKLQILGAPQYIIDESQRILSPQDGKDDLGLAIDLSNLDIAPNEELTRFLHIFANVCLYMRSITSYGSFSPDSWKHFDGVWNDEAEFNAHFNQQISLVLHPIPHVLLQWSQFNEAQFVQSLHNSKITFSADCQDWWMTFFSV